MRTVLLIDVNSSIKRTVLVGLILLRRQQFDVPHRSNASLAGCHELRRGRRKGQTVDRAAPVR